MDYRFVGRCCVPVFGTIHQQAGDTQVNARVGADQLGNPETPDELGYRVGCSPLGWIAVAFTQTVSSIVGI